MGSVSWSPSAEHILAGRDGGNNASRRIGVEMRPEPVIDIQQRHAVPLLRKPEVMLVSDRRLSQTRKYETYILSRARYARTAMLGVGS